MTQTAIEIAPKMIVPAPVDGMCRRHARILAGLKDLHDASGNRALVRKDDLIVHIAIRFNKSYSGLRPPLSDKFDDAIRSLALGGYIKYGENNHMLFLTREGDTMLCYLAAKRPELFEPTSSSNILKSS